MYNHITVITIDGQIVPVSIFFYNRFGKIIIDHIIDLDSECAIAPDLDQDVVFDMESLIEELSVSCAY